MQTELHHLERADTGIRMRLCLCTISFAFPCGVMLSFGGFLCGFADLTYRVLHAVRLNEDSCVRPGSCQRWDFIVGSDLVYNEEGCRLLPRVFAQLASSDTVVLYAHTKRRFEMLDYDFFDNLQKEGLVVEEVKEVWAPEAPPSPDPFATVFPDMRIAVFRITLCNTGAQSWSATQTHTS